ncbi:MAG: hypothetical protein R3F29_03165 [Planctomycetota bacterium]
MIDRLDVCRCGGGLLLAALLPMLATAQVGDAATAPILVPIHTAAADLGVPYGIWAAGKDYKIGFHDGATFVPLLGREYAQTQSLAWRTRSVRVGAHELVRQAPRLRYGARRAEYDLGGCVEAYEVRADGVEQTFVLAERPAATGDLVVIGELHTAMACNDVAAAHQPLLFADAHGNRLVRYGAATAVDADGARRAMTTACEGGVVTLQLDGEWLAAARYPVVVDPIIAGTGFSWGPVREDLDLVRPIDAPQIEVWMACSTWASATDSDVYLQPWTDDGASNTSIYADVTTSWSSRRPCVAAVDGYVLEVFERYFPGTGLNFLRYHRHQLTDTQLDATYGTIVTGDNAWRADVGGTVTDQPGSHALVVWQQETTGPFADTASSDIYGCTVNVAAGTVSPGFLIADGLFTDCERPTVNQVRQHGSEHWLVGYQTIGQLLGQDDWDVLVHAVAPAGAVSAAMTIDASSPDHKMSPRIEGADSRYLVAFVSSTTQELPGAPQGDVGHRVRVARVDWPNGAAGGSAPWVTQTVQTAIDARLQLGALAFDLDTRSHWLLTARSTVSQVVNARTLGYRGRTLQVEQVASVSSTDSTTRCATTFNQSAGTFLLGYTLNDPAGTTLNVTFVDHFEYPPVTPAASVGPACSPANIAWQGSQQIGSQFGSVAITGAAFDSLHVLAMATGTASVPISGVPPIVDGCTLLIPSIGPDFLGLFGLALGDAVQFALPLPESLISATFYFQDFHTVGGGVFDLLATERLELSIVR